MAQSTKKRKNLYGSIDRFEGSVAVIIVGDDEGTIEITKSLLPEGCKEGDLISIKLESKDRKTSTEKERVAGLIRKLSSEKGK
jgi:Protein of unknown function (DUF3006)